MSKYVIPSKIFLEMGGWRQPLIMVDRITDFKYGENGNVQVIKHITYNEPYLLGHFPEDPIMPGVMISEIFGQASEYFSFLCDICDIWQSQQGEELKSLRDIYARLGDEKMREIIRTRRSQVRGVLASQNLKFKDIAYPGDTIEVTSKLAFSDSSGFMHYAVSAHVGKKLISQGTIINFREVK
ncbi:MULTISPECIES: hotdog family protein [Tenebrionibacter/Tenebrionicola group]|jgi:3-hydroxymyristoyl/3-hydroxydecanoyl-(acyl carrier protein) dehydratase|uniref:Beta-hydroxyacyl-ACP dehydratase n=2 Tax=Tenebrionibacter/Tenebrionicola group TaxID=2969848 RepID=A0A8K0XWE6_9ENTR|nr:MULTISPECIES: 3-hydroxyacyl-ACP dehydratase FabZ family protein [Tenebrionibacter/Tenebrionicola group]MBK4715275.1 beta-hydroxyacyl-ACP dehydratase [Tenebrionibacter intestinalis]MBV4413067.1 beta-hydroxyacyl-ACP dehydratase [Tenebrionicola larvae]MBV5096021.1 beta-hydroxyacyl-ACP dehydratase [Tenebrionicola larvae]